MKRNMGIQFNGEGSQRRLPKRRREVCCVCGSGHEGWSLLLVYCKQCYNVAIHRHCLGIIPGSADDTDLVPWFCEFCFPSVEAKSISNMCGDAITKSFGVHCAGQEGAFEIEVEQVENELVLDYDPEPLQILLPESRGVVFLVNSSGEIFIEGTAELDLGVEEKTVELDIGSEEENDVSYPGEPATFSEIVKGVSEEIREHHVHQENIPSNIDVVPLQSASTDYHPEPISLPASEWTLRPIQSGSESQSLVSLSNSSKSKTAFLKPIPLSEPCKSGNQSEMSIPVAVLDLGGKLLERTLEDIDIQVGPYRIRSEMAPILRNVLEKYGDIFHD